jgi:enoyl-CoA hydratase/carnithine racemase
VLLAAAIRIAAGWGNAMRWLLTGEEYDAAEADRIALVQEVVEPGSDLAELFETQDGREGLRSFVERHEARFVGR